MGVEIASRVVATALGLATAETELEVCGLLVGRSGRVVALLPTGNVAGDPATSFEIDPAALIRAYRDARNGGLEVLGCFHSHPNGSPSPSRADAAAAQPGQLWLIAAGGAARLFRFEGGGFIELPLAVPPT